MLYPNKTYGQTTLLQQMFKEVDQGRVPHAQLLLGQNGYGSLFVALEYLGYLLCLDRTEDGACGKCASCQKTSKFIHPDVHFTFPFFSSKGADTSISFYPQWRTYLEGESYPDLDAWVKLITADANKVININKKECSEIIKFFKLKNYESTHKVVVVWMPEYLGQEGNVLLKLIEEPPEGAIFLFVAERQEQILTTILSRCQLSKVGAVSSEGVNDYLIGKGVSVDKADNVSLLAEGNILLADELVDDASNLDVLAFVDWLRKCYGGVDTNLVNNAQELAKMSGEQLKVFFRNGLLFMRELMIYKYTGTSTKLKSEELDSAKKLSKIINHSQINSIITILNDYHYAVERNANTKVALLNASIHIYKSLRKSVVYKTFQL